MERIVSIGSVKNAIATSRQTDRDMHTDSQTGRGREAHTHTHTDIESKQSKISTTILFGGDLGVVGTLHLSGTIIV